jgi:hypothetical protein
LGFCYLRLSIARKGPKKQPSGEQERKQCTAQTCGAWEMVLEENLWYKLLNCTLGIIRGVT